MCRDTEVGCALGARARYRGDLRRIRLWWPWRFGTGGWGGGAQITHYSGFGLRCSHFPTCTRILSWADARSLTSIVRTNRESPAGNACRQQSPTDSPCAGRNVEPDVAAHEPES